jgi:hypothetical protein
MRPMPTTHLGTTSGGCGVTLELVPVTFSDAVAFVGMHHRHNRPPIGHKFSLGVALDGTLVGVAIVGRPVARHFDDGRTLEVNRTATDGTRNAYIDSVALRLLLRCHGYLPATTATVGVGW